MWVLITLSRPTDLHSQLSSANVAGRRLLKAKMILRIWREREGEQRSEPVRRNIKACHIISGVPVAEAEPQQCSVTRYRAAQQPTVLMWVECCGQQEGKCTWTSLETPQTGSVSVAWAPIRSVPSMRTETCCSHSPFSFPTPGRLNRSAVSLPLGMDDMNKIHPDIQILFIAVSVCMALKLHLLEKKVIEKLWWALCLADPNWNIRQTTVQ